MCLRIKRKDFDIRFYPSHLSKRLWLTQYLSDNRFDQEEIFFESYLKPGDIVIDAGANIGFFSLLSSALIGPKGKVYAFEPHPRTYRYLEGNLALNKTENVTTFNIALGNENNVMHFSAEKKKDDHSYITLDDRQNTVSVKKLDDIGIEDDSIALLKLDVEGYEKYVLEGAKNILKKTQCVYFEALSINAARYGYTIADLLDVLAENGFETFEMCDNRVKKITRNTKPPFATTNLVSTRNITELLKHTNHHCE